MIIVDNLNNETFYLRHKLNLISWDKLTREFLIFLYFYIFILYAHIKENLYPKILTIFIHFATRIYVLQE